MPALTRRPQKITFGEMRSSACARFACLLSKLPCSHSTKISADRWSDHVLSGIESLLTCQACGKRGADVRPDFSLSLLRQANQILPQ